MAQFQSSSLPSFSSTWGNLPPIGVYASPSTVSSPTSLAKRTSSVTRTKRELRNQVGRKDDGGWHQRRGKRLTKEVKESDTLLACPFAKHDPIASHECWDFSAESLARLKEHLLRRHDRPSCPICRSQFEDYDAIDTHLRTMICQKVEGEQRGDCMTPDVARKIRRRTKKGETLTEGWQRMYSIMFPGDKTIPSPYVEDIGQLYTERVRKSVTDEFIQHLHSKLNSLSMRGVSNNPSAIKAACVSHLTKVADQYIRGGSNTDEESTVAMAQNLCSHSTWPTAWHPYKKQSSALSSGLLGFDVFGNPVGDGPIPHWQGATVPAFPSCNCRHAEHVSSINPSANWTDYTSHIASHIPNLVHFSDSTDFDNALYVSSSYELSSNAQSTCTWE